MITVVRAGPLTTVQDLGRPGFAHLGVPRSGALDVPALRRANELVGNPPDAAGLETTLLGCALRFAEPARIAVTGARATVTVDGEPVEPGPIEVPAGAVVDIGKAVRGLRSYLAVGGGIAVEPVLGSRSTDTLSGLGPPRLADATVLLVGPPPAPDAPRPDRGSEHTTGSHSSRADRNLVRHEHATDSRGGWSGGRAAEDEVELGIRLGPRDDWFTVADLFAGAYRIGPLSNRVGCRLAGTAVTRAKAGELPPEGVVLGAVQVPADGQPLIFLADHPTTGGYPVIGVIDDVTVLAQARPGTSVRFRELD